MSGRYSPRPVSRRAARSSASASAQRPVWYAVMPLTSRTMPILAASLRAACAYRYACSGSPASSAATRYRPTAVARSAGSPLSSAFASRDS
jgi:hypothetical protein